MGPSAENTVSNTLTALTEAERIRALERFRVIRPYLEAKANLTRIATDAEISLRTARYWVSRYRTDGLIGLTRKPRGDKHARGHRGPLGEIIEGLALQKPAPSVATVHRQASAIAATLGEKPLSYSAVYSVVKGLAPSLLSLAHQGTKVYSDKYDLVVRHEADKPNAVWQADHTELDILLRDDHGRPCRPWLTIILDDYSRAIAGFMLSFAAPSAIQTALALRHAIWRKTNPRWHVCGLPEVLYTDHGSDFTSRHIEQVAAALKIRLVFSLPGRPRGRGKVERFFEALSQVFLPRLPGCTKGAATNTSSLLTLGALTAAVERYLVDEYLITPHRTTGQSPQERWQAGGFLPHMPDSLERLDLLLLTVPKTRQVRPDGIHFLGMRYLDPTLGAYVGETVLLRYDPRDIAEIRIFHEGRFLCRAVCQELAGETISLRDVVSARNRRRRQLRQTIIDRRRQVDTLIEARRFAVATPEVDEAASAERVEAGVRLKRYVND